MPKTTDFDFSHDYLNDGKPERKEFPSGVFEPKKIHISPERKAMIKEIITRRRSAYDELAKY